LPVAVADDVRTGIAAQLGEWTEVADLGHSILLGLNALSDLETTAKLSEFPASG
jgi:hypothetical protein